MDLKLFDSIIFGELRPFLSENRTEDYFESKIRPKFTIPENSGQFEDQLKLVLKNHPYLFGQNEFLINLDPEKETIEIKLPKDDIFEPLFDIDTPQPFNYTTEFYFYLIKNEATRFRTHLISKIELVNNQDDAVFIIKKVITQLEFFLSNLGKEIKALPDIQSNYYVTPKNETESERIQKNTHYIFNFLLLTLVGLYYEMETLFAETFEIQFKSREHLLYNVIGKPNDSFKKLELSKNTAINYVKKNIEAQDFDVVKAYKNWAELIKYFKNDNKNHKLEQAIAAIENKLFLQTDLLKPNNYSFAELHSYKFFDDVSSQVKDICNGAINLKVYGFERLEVVDGFIDAISKQFKGHDFENESVDNSVPRNLLKWLSIQSKLYGGELSKSFSLKAEGNSINKIYHHITLTALYTDPNGEITKKNNSKSEKESNKHSSKVKSDESIYSSNSNINEESIVTNKTYSTEDNSSNEMKLLSEPEIKLILETLEKLQITKGGRYCLGDRKKSSVRAVLEIMIEKNKIPNHSIKKLCLEVSEIICADIKSLPDINRDTYPKYKNMTNSLLTIS